MAGLKSYDPNKPAISIDKGDWLDRMAKSGIPLTRALEYFRDNPEGEATETASLATEDLAPFYSSIINDGDVEDYVKEAVLMAMPMPRGSGKRYKVNTDVNGVPDFNDLKKWGKDKSIQYDSFLESRPSYRLAEAQKELDNFYKYNKYSDPMTAARRVARTTQNVTEAALETLDESPYYYDKVESWGLIPDNARFRGNISRGKYIYDKLVDEYGPVDGTYYYEKLWESDHDKYPHSQDIGADRNLYDKVYEKYHE